MRFHLGRPILVMLILAVISGGWTWLRPPQPGSNLVVWVFDETQAKIYREGTKQSPSLVDLYQEQTGEKVRVELISSHALDTRLISLFMSGGGRGRVPDLVKVEINSAGKFFRMPAGKCGFLPLNSYLEKSGVMDKIVKARLSPWSKGGQVFGVPEDVHPVTITYRKDLFDEAGIDLAGAQTWAEFQERCLAFQAYWRGRGVRDRYAMELSTSSADSLGMLLLQRRVNVLDSENRIHLDEPKVAQTVAFYAQMVGGSRKIGIGTSPGMLWVRDFAQGHVCAVLTPDWRAGYIKEYAPELAGKVAMMQLPRFEANDAPTSTAGGTMIGIPRECRDPEAAWKLLEFFCFSKEGMKARQRYSTILPPMKEYWKNATYHEADPFYAGQRVEELYVNLADQIPERYVTPYSAFGGQALSTVLAQAVRYADRYGETGLEPACQKWLSRASYQLQQFVQFGKLEP